MENKGVKKPKDLLKYLIEDVCIPNIIWIGLGLLIAALVGLINTIRGLYNYLLTQTIPPVELFLSIIAIVICAFGGFIGMRCLQISRRKTSPQIESSYTVIDSEFELFFQNRETVTSRQTIRFKVTAPKLLEIPHAITWTGSSFDKFDLDDDSKRRGYRLEMTRSSSETHIFKVVFPREYKYNESDTYTILTTAGDAKHTMLPFLCRHIKCQTNSLRLMVTAPRGMLCNCTHFISADQEGETKLSDPAEIPRESIGGYDHYKYKIDKPDLLRFYRIGWDFA